MKAAVPVPYIIALIFAVAVIAIVGYWYYTTGGSFQQQLSEVECRNLALQYCRARFNQETDVTWEEWLEGMNKGGCSQIISDIASTCQNLGFPLPA